MTRIRGTVLARALVVAVALATVTTAVPAAGQADVRAEAQKFIDTYSERWNRLSYEHSLADWQANTYIVEGDESNAKAASAALERLTAFTGSKENIEAARKLLEAKAKLTPTQVKQLETILYIAANNPQTAQALVKKRIAAETAAVQEMYGFEFKIGGKPVSPNRIDEILKTSTKLDERLEAWRASKEVGRPLKDNLVELRDLRNGTVKALGYESYFSYQVSEYNMTDDEMMALVAQINRELRPLYRELHTWARYELANRYNAPVPDEIPAHWLPNRWGQDWSTLVEVEGVNVDAALKTKSPEWIVRQAEDFYVSLGWPKLPESFWSQSSLYPVAEGSKHKKNTHASAWHLDRKEDVRSLMSVEPNAEWYETSHHELGHVYYYISYTNPEVPLLLREGANRAYHEAIGSLMGLASMQQPYLEARGLATKGAKVDPNEALLREALNFVVFIPFSTGTMTSFEHDLYAENLSTERFNDRWWELARKYQGIAPPADRGDDMCDACTKTHVIDDPGQYYDYALSNVLLFQLHDHIARNILKQDPHATNYYGNKAVGDFLRDIMRHGASRDWRQVLREKTGEDLSAKAMVRYFEPLMAYLKKANEGRKYTLPEV
jgi:peptidyl-dipeptidase A